MIEVRDLRRAFRPPGEAPVQALESVSLSARGGEITGILGPNGAGKTTLFRILAGVLRGDSGSARVMGRDPAERGGRMAAGLLTEEPALPGRSTPAWHLEAHARLRGDPPSRARERALSLLERMGAAEAGPRRCAALSRGQRQRVAIARALIGDPDVLLMDEPANGLDIEASALVRAEMIRLAAAVKTVLLATHQAHEAERLCAVVWVLRGGRVLAGGTPADLRRATGTRSLEDAYLRLQGSAA